MRMTFEELVRDWNASTAAGSVEFSPSDVPHELHPLIPYAKVFGVSDDGYRLDLLCRTPGSLKAHVKDVVLEFEDALETWLAGPEANAPPSEAYVAFSTLLMAADTISSD
jgi:hypothetical protein